jgi:DNA-binding CsgD family transcriptional regulator
MHLSMLPVMIGLKHILSNTRHIAMYALPMAVLVFALKWLQWKFLIIDNSLDIYIGLIAVFFTALGVWVALQLVKPKVHTVIIEKEIFVPQPHDFALNEAELEKLNFSRREYEVLQLVTQGYSNAEIAEALFLSVSTIKTYVSGLLEKMDVRSRTQAIEKAKRLKIHETKRMDLWIGSGNNPLCKHGVHDPPVLHQPRL